MKTVKEGILKGLSDDEQQKVLDNISKGESESKSCSIYNITAPLVVPIALLFCEHESEELPKWARKWNNNVNLNGDNGFWLDKDNDGVPDTIGMPLDYNKETLDKCYWVPKFLQGRVHPRSYIARFFWIGLRNRGKQSYVDKGIKINQDKPLVTKELISNDTVEKLHERDGVYLYTKTKRILKYFVLTTQKGWKVANTNIINDVAIPVGYTAVKIKFK